MKRFRSSSTLLAYLAAAAVAVALAVGLTARPSVPSATDQVEAIAAELRCPVCQGLSVADSPSAAATEIRRQIAEQLAAGRTPAQVKEHFAARYGDWILLAPRTELAWLIPPLTLVAGAAGLILWLRRRTPARPSTLAAEEIGRLAPMRKRVRREVHELDA